MIATARSSLAAALLGGFAAAASASLQDCTPTDTTPAGRQAQLLQLTAQVRQALADSGQPVALVSRSGLDLSRFGQVYSHAGLALRDSANGPGSVRQLYFACAEGRPRLFDEGLAGFVLGAGVAARPRVALLLLPLAAGQALATAALDDRRALGLLHPHYSANAHAYSARYQNCNQWVAELMASAWAGLVAPAALASSAAMDRHQAQAWLRAQGYQPARVQVGPWRGLSLFSPFLHEDDHPPEAAAAGEQAVSLPVSLEALSQRLWPGSRRLEWCLRDATLVTREGAAPLDADCHPGPGDRVVPLL